MMFIDLAAAGADRAGHRAAVGARRPRRSPSARRSSSSRSGAHRRAQRARSRRRSPATRWSRCSAASARSSERFAREERGAVPGQLRRAVHLRHHHAGDDVHREPQLRRDRRGRRAAGGHRRDEPRRRAGVHPVLAAVHPAAHPGRVDGQPAAVRASRRPSGSSSCSTPRSRRPTRPTPAPPTARSGRVEFEHVSFRYDPDQPADRGPVAGRRAGPDGRDRRPDRRRQDHAGQPDHALLRARRRPDHARRRRHRRRCAATSCASQIGMVLQDTWLFGGTIRDNIAYGNPDATEEQILAAARGDLRRPVRALAARRLRHGDRRRGRQRQRRARSS